MRFGIRFRNSDGTEFCMMFHKWYEGLVYQHTDIFCFCCLHLKKPRIMERQVYDLSIGSIETKYIKLNTKTPIFLIIFDFCIHFKENFFFSFCFFVTHIKVYKKVVKFSFKQQKIFWVLVFGFMYLVLVDAMD